MTPLILTLALLTPEYQCRVDDAACWMTAALAQQERAERAEARVRLLEEARAIGDQLLADSDARGERWRKLAEHVAPKQPMFYEQPMFWLGVGLIAGIGVTAGVAAAVR